MVRSPNRNPPDNQFLAGLPGKDFEKLAPHLKKAPLNLDTILHLQGESTQVIHFPLNHACVSLVNTSDGGRGVEVALIGSEGLLGTWAVLGSNSNMHEAVVQVAGDCLQLQKEVLRAEIRRGGVLMERFHLYMRYLMAQISQTAVCNRVHRLEQRLARWLLMTQDHAKTNRFDVTHEFLSRMVGADRSDVTIAAGILRKSGTISYSRGKVEVLNRKALESASCECYQVLLREYNLLYQDGSELPG